jgi:hypothetical protein
MAAKTGPVETLGTYLKRVKRKMYPDEEKMDQEEWFKRSQRPGRSNKERNK